MNAIASILWYCVVCVTVRTKEKRNEYKAFRVSGKVNVFAVKTYASFCVSCDENQSPFSIVYACEISRWLWFKVKKKLEKKNMKKTTRMVIISREKTRQKGNLLNRQFEKFIWKVPLINICVRVNLDGIKTIIPAIGFVNTKGFFCVCWIWIILNKKPYHHL